MPSTADDVRPLTQRLAALAFCRADLLLELDRDGSIVFAEGVTPWQLGRKVKDLLGTRFIDLVAASDHRVGSELLESGLSHGRIDEVALRMRAADGQTPDAMIGGYRVEQMDGHFFLAIKIGGRCSGRKVAEVERDAATGMMDKQAFADVAAERLQSFGRTGGEAQMTMVRLENLVQAEASLSGDEKQALMGSIGEVLRAQSLGGDTAGRIDGENFGFVHTAGVDVGEITAKIEKLAKEALPDGIEIATNAATLDAGEMDMSEEQVAKAIAFALNEFSSGKAESSCANLSDAVAEMANQTMKSIQIFRKICASEAFNLVFMPISDMVTGQVHHFEALSRFEYGASGEVSPFRMITLAEEMGEITEFDLAVARKAIKTLAPLWRSNRRLPKTALNLSGHSISDAGFVKRLHAFLNSERGLNKVLMFEITESAKIEDLAGVNAAIQGLRSRGFEVCLDDFGAGAASFDYLHALEVDVVKFDGPVVKRAISTQRGKALLGSMAAMCKEIGIETVAEMVETKEEAEFLADCGVELGQGWYFGKPDPAPTSFL